MSKATIDRHQNGTLCGCGAAYYLSIPGLYARYHIYIGSRHREVVEKLEYISTDDNRLWRRIWAKWKIKRLNRRWYYRNRWKRRNSVAAVIEGTK